MRWRYKLQGIQRKREFRKNHKNINQAGYSKIAPLYIKAKYQIVSYSWYNVDTTFLRYIFEYFGESLYPASASYRNGKLIEQRKTRFSWEKSGLKSRGLPPFRVSSVNCFTTGKPNHEPRYHNTYTYMHEIYKNPRDAPIPSWNP